MSEISKKISDILKPALVDAITAKAMAALIAIPGFGWVFALPVVKQVTEHIIGKIAEWAVYETAFGLSLLWIQLDMAWEIDNVEGATQRLKDMLENPDKYSEKQQKEINEFFDEKALELIRLSIARL